MAEQVPMPGEMNLDQFREYAKSKAWLPAWARGCAPSQAAHVMAGRHPTGEALGSFSWPETCGSCAHCKVKTFSKNYIKCGLHHDSGGPATDIRRKWPACAKWEAAEPQKNGSPAKGHG